MLALAKSQPAGQILLSCPVSLLNHTTINLGVEVAHKVAVDAVLANLVAVLTMKARRRRRVVVNHWGRGEGERGG